MRGNLTIEQAFYLTLFLRCRSNDKLISDVGHAFGDAGINVWGVGFNLNNLGRIAKGLLSTLEREDNFKEIVREPNTDKIAYIGFKESIWKTIRFDKDVLTETDFNERWQWFGWT